ncbi:Nuclear control of ATPase protein 2 [Podila verticillata]|nr:Nuclear control of ATPase protein 2 [Podila verticillata]KAI9234988.1 MAG: ATP synthase regulation protein NCA2-domain-containing protein [Podila humilis]
MGTFITDKLQHLNNDLVQLFHLDAQPPIDIANNNIHHNIGSEANAPGTRRKLVDSSHSNDHHDDTQATIMAGLRASIDSLDLRSSVVPPMERVIVEIERVQGIVGSLEHEEGSKLSQLEHLFLAKCTVVVYLNLLDIILNATLPLSNEIEYWQSLLDGPKWRLLYILQTSPQRLFNLTKEAALSTRAHMDSLIESGLQTSDRTAHIIQLIHYFPTFLKKHLISQPVSFPVAIHYEISGHRKQLQRIREYQAECLGLLAEQGLNLDPEHFEQDPISARSDISELQSRDEQEEGRRGQVEGSSTTQAEKFVLEQISKTVVLMERVLTRASKDAPTLTDQKFAPVALSATRRRNASRSLTVLGNLHGISNFDCSDMYSHLKDLIQVQIPDYVKQTESQSRQFYRPSWLTRVWIPIVISYFGLKYGIQYISEHRADLDEMLEEGWDTAKRFMLDWIWEPSVRIMNIIRHTDDQGSLQMLGNESLKSDIASLERMVLDFGKEHYQMGSDQLSFLSKAVHNGDISVVMRAYERELKTPLKGAISGNLVQTLLIQIQKTKVDVEVAMAALDKLLKANELNFAFLAVGPSLLLLWAVSSQAKSSWQKFAGKNLGVVSIQMRNSLRQVERLLNLASADVDNHGHGSAMLSRPSAKQIQAQRIPLGDSQAQRSTGNLSEDFSEVDVSSDSIPTTPTEPLSNSLSSALAPLSSEKLQRIRAKQGKVPYRTQGLILCEVHLLRTFARRLTRSEGLRDKVMEDLREIEESSLTVRQRLRTAKRMYRTYGFLGLYH